MKSILTAALIAIAYSGAAFAEEKHDHDHDHIIAGPTGGRVLTIVEPHAEFFVNKDKKVEIRFVNDDLKAVPAGEQIVTVTMGDRKSPTKLTFTKDGDKLVSDKAVPAGNDYPTVVMIKEKKGAKSKVAKFNLNMSDCPGCKYQEYACTCDHDHDDEPAKKK
jgi:hypothetical protein